MQTFSLSHFILVVVFVCIFLGGNINRFAESILGAQSTKLKLQQLRKSVTTRGTYKLSCLELWLQDTLKSVIGIFPVVFDKALAFAKPLYGFEDDMDFSPTTNTSDDSITHYRNNTVADAFEADVVDALQKHENVGAMSIAIVIDAIRTSNVRVESGFSPFDRGTVDTGADIEAAIRKQYPAVYIRTLSSMTAPSAPNSPRSSPSGVPGGQKSPMANNGSGLSLIGRGLRRDGSRKDRLGASMSSPQTPTSNRKVFRSWSNDDSSQRSQQQLHATSPSLQKKGSKAMYALEYGSEDGPGNNNVSWPHSEWTNLATAISENAADGSSENRRDMVFYSKERMLKSPESDNRLGGHGPRLSYCQQSLYCIDSLSDSMWLVAIVKDFEQPTSGWHWQSPRHSTESVEDKLRELVSNLASMVRISDRFEAPSCRLSRDTFLERSSDEIGAGLAEELKERGLDQGQIGSEKIVLFIKNQLKVLAQSNSMAGSSLTSTSRLLRRSRRGKLLHHPGHAESAAAFFLGQELMKGLIFD